MVYEERDEMELAEEDRLYESDPYRGAEFSDTFREQLSEDTAEEDTLSEDEATTSGTMPETATAEPVRTDEFGEKVTTDEPVMSEDEERDPYDE